MKETNQWTFEIGIGNNSLRLRGRVYLAGYFGYQNSILDGKFLQFARVFREKIQKHPLNFWFHTTNLKSSS